MDSAASFYSAKKFAQMAVDLDDANASAYAALSFPLVSLREYDTALVAC